MVKRTAIVLMLAACAAAFGEDNPNQKCVESLGEAQADVTNVASLQKGSRNSSTIAWAALARLQRWNRVAKDLRLSDEQLRQNLIFTAPRSTLHQSRCEKRRDRMVRRAPPTSPSSPARRDRTTSTGS